MFVMKRHSGCCVSGEAMASFRQPIHGATGQQPGGCRGDFPAAEDFLIGTRGERHKEIESSSRQMAFDATTTLCRLR
jgi:hypothetical protein